MRARRGADLEGMPRIRLGPVASFHEHLRNRQADLPVFTDELYLEQHNGTLTTHGDIKSRNRRLEQALATTEILLAHAPAAAWPKAEFDRLWKILLLRQFHDILPGTSIREVYAEAIPTAWFLSAKPAICCFSTAWPCLGRASSNYRRRFTVTVCAPALASWFLRNVRAHARWRG